MTENVLTESILNEKALKARNMVGRIQGNCGQICDVFEGLLNDEAGLPWKGDFTGSYRRREVRVGPSGEEKHYVFEIDGIFIETYCRDELIWIDLSFDQFNDSNNQKGLIEITYGKKENLEKVRIMGEKDKRRQQYMTVGEFL